MNGVHDMGGMHGMGPIEIEKNEPVFHAAWEGRSYVMNRAMGAWGGNSHARRYAIEILPPADYLRMSYYEKWFVRLINMQLEAGRITREEVASGTPAPGSVKLTPPLRADQVAAFLHPPARKILSGAPARFRNGQSVRAKKINPTGHTRLPRYARGRLGVIDRDLGVFSFPDALAHSLPDKPQHCYSVRFAARELWGDQASARDSVYLDLFDDYLEPA